MDDYKHRYLYLKSCWEEYSQLQLQIKKDRRIILLCACVLCLFIGFMAGMILFSLEGHVVVSLEAPAQKSEANKELIIL